jgi:hypothetical protein
VPEAINPVSADDNPIRDIRAEFVAMLEQLRLGADKPSYLAITRKSQVSENAIKYLFSKKSLHWSRWETVGPVVAALGGDPDEWRQRWEEYDNRIKQAKDARPPAARVQQPASGQATVTGDPSAPGSSSGDALAPHTVRPAPHQANTTRRLLRLPRATKAALVGFGVGLVALIVAVAVGLAVGWWEPGTPDQALAVGQGRSRSCARVIVAGAKVYRKPSDDSQVVKIKPYGAGLELVQGSPPVRDDGITYQEVALPKGRPRYGWMRSQDLGQVPQAQLPPATKGCGAIAPPSAG